MFPSNTLTYIPHTIVSQMKNSLTPGFSLQIYLKLRIPHKKYAFPQDTAPSTLFFLVNTAKDTYASPSSKHWNLTPHHFLEKGFNMVNPLDSSQSSFHLWRFLLSTSSFFRMTIFYFFHTSMIIIFFTGSATCSSNAGVVWGFILGLFSLPAILLRWSSLLQ